MAGQTGKRGRWWSHALQLAVVLVVLGVVGVHVVRGRPGKERDAHCQRGQEHFQAKEYDRAIEEYTEALRLDPGSAVAYASRAAAYLYQRQFDRAIEDCNRAL